MRVSIEDPSTTLRLLDLAAGVVLVTATALVAWHVPASAQPDRRG
ncbi:MAG: hypothetical protein R2709_13495 [Marmoricola sp.]